MRRKFLILQLTLLKKKFFFRLFEKRLLKAEKKNFLFALVFFVCLFWGQQSEAASFYFSPKEETYQIGETFLINVFVSSDEQAAGYLEGVLAYNKDIISIVSISRSNSIVSSWDIQPSYSNDRGTISFKTSKLEPVFQGSSGKVFAVIFKALSSGQSKIEFQSGKIYALDDQKSEIKSEYEEANISIRESNSGTRQEQESKENVVKTDPSASPLINCTSVPDLNLNSSSHPDPEKWYSARSVEMKWDLPSGALGVSYSWDRNPLTNPQNISSELSGSKRIENLEDGIWYFHLRIRSKAGLCKTYHQKIKIDSVPPLPFNIKMSQKDEYDPNPIISLTAKDETSGIMDFELKIGKSDAFRVEADSSGIFEFKLQNQPVGERRLIVRAFDQAGNEQMSSVIIKVKSLKKPIILDYPTGIFPHEALVLKGSGPVKTAIIFYSDQYGEQSIGETKSDAFGRWTYVLPPLFGKGEHYIFCLAQSEKGITSQPSSKAEFTVDDSFFFKAKRMVSDYWTVLLVILGVILLSFTIFSFVMERMIIFTFQKSQTKKPKRPRKEDNFILGVHKVSEKSLKKAQEQEASGTKNAQKWNENNENGDESEGLSFEEYIYDPAKEDQGKTADS